MNKMPLWTYSFNIYIYREREKEKDRERVRDIENIHCSLQNLDNEAFISTSEEKYVYLFYVCYNI